MSVIRQTVQVLPGHRVEFVVPELNDGDWAKSSSIPVNHRVPVKQACWTLSTRCPRDRELLVTGTNTKRNSSRIASHGQTVVIE